MAPSACGLSVSLGILLRSFLEAKAAHVRWKWAQTPGQCQLDRAGCSKSQVSSALPHIMAWSRVSSQRRDAHSSRLSLLANHATL